MEEKIKEPIKEPSEEPLPMETEEEDAKEEPMKEMKEVRARGPLVAIRLISEVSEFWFLTRCFL